MWRSTNRRMTFQTCLRIKKKDTISKITNTKRVLAVA
jgi:hypothetical protein